MGVALLCFPKEAICGRRCMDAHRKTTRAFHVDSLVRLRGGIPDVFWGTVLGALRGDVWAKDILGSGVWEASAF